MTQRSLRRLLYRDALGRFRKAQPRTRSNVDPVAHCNADERDGRRARHREPIGRAAARRNHDLSCHVRRNGNAAVRHPPRLADLPRTRTRRFESCVPSGSNSSPTAVPAASLRSPAARAHSGSILISPKRAAASAAPNRLTPLLRQAVTSTAHHRLAEPSGVWDDDAPCAPRRAALLGRAQLGNVLVTPAAIPHRELPSPTVTLRCLCEVRENGERERAKGEKAREGR